MRPSHAWRNQALKGCQEWAYGAHIGIGAMEEQRLVRRIQRRCFAALAFWILTIVPSLVCARAAPEDFARLRFVSSAVSSHHGKHVVFVVSRLDVAKNQEVSNLWLADTNTASLRLLASGDRDSQPNWAPDDRTIAFTSARWGHDAEWLKILRG